MIRAEGFRLGGGVLVAALLAGCGLLFAEGEGGDRSPSGATPPTPDARVLQLPFEAPGQEALSELPSGLGTLRQDQISIRLRRGEVEILVVPLEEAVIRTASPDTWERLSALGEGHRRWFRDRTGTEGAFRLFLVALYSESITEPFEEEELVLVSGGLRTRAVGIRGITPTWDQQRLLPGEAQMAVYAFPPEISLGPDLEVEYREIRTREWSRILPLVQSEQARIRARGGE
jgi:hypothetical protein